MALKAPLNDADQETLRAALRVVDPRTLAKRADVGPYTVARAGVGYPLMSSTARVLIAACNDVLREAHNVAA